MPKLRVIDRFLGIVFTILVFSILGSDPILAQENSTDTLVEALKPALEQAEQSGATIIIVSPDKEEVAAAEPDEADYSEQVMTLRQEFRSIVMQADQFFPRLSRAINAADESIMSWVSYSLILAAAGILVSYLVSRWLDRWGERQFESRFAPESEKRSDKLAYALSRSAGMIVINILGGLSGLLIIFAIVPNNLAIRGTAILIVVSVIIIRLAQAVFRNLFLPDKPEYRVINLDDKTAISLNQTMNRVTIACVMLFGFMVWTEALGLERDSQKLFEIVILFLGALIIGVAAVHHRNEIGEAITGGLPDELNTWLVRKVARFWHVGAVVYLAIAWAISAARTTLDHPSADGLILSPVMVLIVALAVYAIALLVIEKFSETRVAKMTLQRKNERAALMAAHKEDDEELILPDDGPLEWVFKPLIEHAVGLVITTGSLVFMAGLWGVNIQTGEGAFLGGLQVLFVAFLSYIAYRAVELGVAPKQEEPEDHVPSAEPGGAGATRLATFMPIFRNFLLITIIVIGSMIILSQMGLDIAPLFAGAGVVGLAIGFGAQSLVRDIFSGAFFLMDDAFRMGEYVDIGSAKGVVEKISVRSFQLRHHNGPLNTVPFGEVKQLTNFSRDWVMMKLKLRVTYDTDIERVRKLIKKLGQRLMEDEELGPMFLQPLKSQGVIEMQDSAMIIRVKFMTRPGDQWTIRPKVYAKIRELFAQEGIHFAHSEVTVRVATDNDQPLTDVQKTAAAAAGGRAVQAKKLQAQSATPQDDR